MNAESRARLIGELSRRGTAELEGFFISRGLGGAFAAPSKGWGRQKRVNEALLAAERRGDLDAVLQSAARHFDIEQEGDMKDEGLGWLRVSAGEAESEIGEVTEQGRTLLGRAER